MARPLIHRVPEFTPGGGLVVRYFRTMTEAKAFSREQAERLGLRGYTIESLPADLVVDLMETYVPVPDHYRALFEPTQETADASD